MDAENPIKLEKKKGSKPQKKKAPVPEIRQTITSYKRMLKANPILELQMKGIKVNDYFNQLASKSQVKSDPTTSNTAKQQGTFNKPQINPLRRTQSLKFPKPNTSSLSQKIHPSVSKPLTTNIQTQRTGKEHPSKATGENKLVQKNTLSRKIVTSHGNNANIPAQSVASQNKAIETKVEVHTKGPAKHAENSTGDVPSVSPIARRKSNNFAFNTPQSYKRKSVSFLTPQSIRKQSLFQSTPAPGEMKKLQDRLNMWLKSRGKPQVLFKSMSLFGIAEKRKQNYQNPISEENKENIEVNEPDSSSYEQLGICENTISEEETIKTNVNIDNGAQQALELNHENLAKYAKEAMKELLTLIEEDYPRNQCLAWLDLIKTKYNKADNEPEYWECRAAIEQSAGNIQNAVEFYEAAIIQGAEVNSVNTALDQLLKKFSLLNISLTELEPKNRDHADRERIVKEARNIFKSTIINFAVGMRNSKKNNAVGNTEAKLVTPVRRSTRISRGHYASTPGLKMCNSLRDLDLTSEEIQFQSNNALI